MPVKIRLKKMGAKKMPHFKIIVCDQHKSRDTKAIEELGFYDPSQNPALIKINRERAAYWIGVGAQMSNTIRSIIEKNKA